MREDSKIEDFIFSRSCNSSYQANQLNHSSQLTPNSALSSDFHNLFKQVDELYQLEIRRDVFWRWTPQFNKLSSTSIQPVPPPLH